MSYNKQMQKSSMITKQIPRSISIHSSIGSCNWLKHQTHNYTMSQSVFTIITKDCLINKMQCCFFPRCYTNYYRCPLRLTGLMGIALNAVALQYTIVSSPTMMTPHSGGGTGISKSAPLSRLFWDHGPSIKSLSFNETSYVLTWRASLLSCRIIKSSAWRSKMPIQTHDWKRLPEQRH